MERNYTTRTTCRACGGDNLTPILYLGEQYVSDFLEPGMPPLGGKVPIDIHLCKHCSLVQNIHTAPQEILYARHYWYRSGVTETMRLALRSIVIAATESVEIYPGDVVLDIGSNDGTLLRHYSSKVVKTVGVDPATNLAQLGSDRVNVFINDFWSKEVYFKHVNQKAKVVTAIGMFYDLEDPNKFIADIADVLHEDGVFIAQLMCLKNMLATRDIGNFAHEHLEFYSLESLERLFDKYNLEIYDLETNCVNGESYRLFIRHVGSKVKARNAKLAASRLFTARLYETSYKNPLFYQTLYAQMEENRKKVYDTIVSLKEQGKKVWVYGASTKGNVILQYMGLDNTLIEGAAERSPEKWGKVTVGTNIPIYSEQEARDANPDYFLVLPYAFFNEMYKRENDWVNKGGKFIIPLPEMRIV